MQLTLISYSCLSVCQLPQDTGPCRGAFSKFFFDSEIRQCREFMFGGCHGNANRFSSLHECQSVCHELKKVVGKSTSGTKNYVCDFYFMTLDII